MITRAVASKHLRRPAWMLALLLPVLALAGCGGSHGAPAKTVTVTTAARTAVPEAVLLGGGIPKVVERVEPEVVTVLAGDGIGSGVIYRANGIVLTNDHVVSGAQKVEIELADGQRAPGRVIATDPDTDLALVHIDRTGLPAASFAASAPPVGALAIVIGSPLGFENSVTAGIVSGLHRSIPGSASESSALVDLMQTDAPISPGNSGGAVVDAQGRVIGISEAYIPPEQGAVAIGFAIPATTAVSVADQLLKSGHVQHAFIGVDPAQLTPELAARLGLRETAGIIVYGVSAGGPAAAAQIQPGDILTALDGSPLRSVEDLYAALRKRRPGETVKLKLTRGGRALTVDVRLSDKPQYAGRGAGGGQTG